MVFMFLPFSNYSSKQVEDVHCSSHTLDVSLSSGIVDGYDVELDLEILACFPERSMCRLGDDPGVVSTAKEKGFDLHLRFRDPFCLPRPISVSLDGHQDRLGPA